MTLFINHALGAITIGNKESYNKTSHVTFVMVSVTFSLQIVRDKNK